ncbi:hypothetical protein B0T25DRAFT_86087 [Lasiosphaeria hispida]|uniref:PHD-type domain-containing protein n=1 Tax=Lasiosphaeria hispida TaxID=260671 RepID=A0AAJ0HPR0_9PEZI|nr:hypothetical protein B0T25DRAFT_86087 [Lasiosphaeria hispida]
MPPHCHSKRCQQKTESFDTPLIKCNKCAKYYHPACHTPYPEATKKWTCQTCITKAKRERHNDSLSQPLHATFRSSSSSMSRSTHSSAMASSSGVARSCDPEDDPHNYGHVRCSAPKCMEWCRRSQVMCPAHLDSITDSGSTRTSNSASAPPSGSQPGPGQSAALGSGYPPHPTINKNKLLAEVDVGGRPQILRRKTAGQTPFVPAQHSSKRPTSSLGQDSAAPPVSPKPTNGDADLSASTVPNRHSQDGQPSRKRPRLSPSPCISPESQPNGAEASSRTKSYPAPSSKPDKGPDAQTTRNQQPGRPHEVVGFYGIKPSKAKKLNTAKLSVSKQPVRKMAPPIRSFAFIEGLEGNPPPVERPPEPKRPHVNGAEASGSQKSDEESLTFNKELQSFWMRKNQPSSSSANKESAAPIAPLSSRPSTQAGGYGHREQDRSTMAERCTAAEFPIRTQEDIERVLDRAAKKLGAPRGSQGQGWANGIPSPTLKPLPLPTNRATQNEARELNPIRTSAFEIPQEQRISVTRKPVDESIFDALIYSQEGAATPPPQVQVFLPAEPTTTPQERRLSEVPPDEPHFADIDPRVHWMQPHSAEWHADKARKIRARGGRKANFGKAAARLRQQRLAGETVPSRDVLPLKIQENPAWVKCLEMLGEIPDEEGQVNGFIAGASMGVGVPSAPLVATTMTGRRKPGMGKRTVSNGHGNGNKG